MSGHFTNNGQPYEGRYGTDIRYAPPAIAPAFDFLEPPPPLAAEEGVAVPPGVDWPERTLEEPELDIMIVGGLVGLASGSLPAACASVASNPGFYAQSVS